MSTKKTTNRPIVSIASGIESGDKKNIAARFKSFAAFQDAGATAESLAAKGAHFDDFKEGVLIGWQGAAFAKKFLNTVEGKAILSGRVMDRFGGSEVVSKTKNEWSTDLSGKVGKLRKAYADWAAEGVVVDAPAGKGDPAEKPAGKRKSGAKKSLKARIVHDTGAMAKAIVANAKSDKRATDVNHETILVAFNRVLELCGEKPVKS